MGDDRAKIERVAVLGEVLTPGHPIERWALFAGRTEQVMDVVSAVGQRGQHVIIYGERGIGKTSLASVLAEIFAERPGRPFRSARVNAAGDDDFGSLWHKIFRELEGDSQQDSPDIFQESLRLQNPGPEDVRFRLQRVDQDTIIVIDEIDTVNDDETSGLIADTIKTLSDHVTPVTLVLVGVADSVEELISSHESIERALVQVHMPRMRPDELAQIIDKAMATLEMSIDEESKGRIARLSEGLPYFTHLLGYNAVFLAITDDRQQVTPDDVERAIGISVTKAQHTVRVAYNNATTSPQPETLHKAVLLACALAPKNEFGFFTAAGVRHPMARIMGKTYEIPAFSRHLNEFAGPLRGPVLEKKGTTRRFLYRFITPLLQPYVILHGLANQLITEELLAELQLLERQRA